MSRKGSMKTRTYVVPPSLLGWSQGFMAGLSASDYAFDPGLAKVTVRPVNPVTPDVEALRGDVGRAQQANLGGGHPRFKLAETS